MINKLIDAISLNLNSEFGDSYNIYTEEVKQGLKTPCFFINTLNNQESLFRGNKYFKSNPFVIQYIPNTNDKKNECNEVNERLYKALEYITAQDDDLKEYLIRGTNMSGEYNEGILNFLVNYDLFVYKSRIQAENMENYDFANNVEG